MYASTVPLEGPTGLSDLLLERAGQVRLELAAEGEPTPDAQQGEVDGGLPPRVRLSEQVQALQHRRLWQRVKSAIVSHGLKMIGYSIPVHHIALHPAQPYRIAAAFLLRETATSKRLSYALDVDNATAHRYRTGEVGNPIGDACAWLHALAAKGLATDRFLALFAEAVERGAAEYEESHAYLRRA